MGKNTEIKDPERIGMFLKKTGNLDWADAAASLETLYTEATELLRHEIAYYYRIRQQKKALSKWLRSGALIFGTLGILAPLADAADLSETGNYGYLLLAVAGALITANNLFGGTTGHARFVATQLALEQIIALGSVKWNQLRSQYLIEENKNEFEQEMFDFIVSLLEKGYQVIIDETSEWSDALESALADYEKRLKQARK